jgi:hypothetical protein
MDSCATLHNITYNGIEEDESRQEEDKENIVPNKKRHMRKKGKKNMIMKT